MINLSTPDFTQHPPRSPRVRLGGYVHLPRLLDKARAVVAGKQGEFHYNCPLDQRFFAFTGIDSEAMLAEIKAGKTDGQMLAWVETQTTRQSWEITQWSAWLSQLSVGSADMHAWFVDMIKANGPEREDITTFFDLLDLDDYVSYGGKA
ncbi:MAG: DUF5069 domain-containing protein [Opitutaceae bacterium]|jgi:hypothetical protein